MPLPSGSPTAIPGSSAAGLDIIKSALRLIGYLESGETPSDDEAQDALMILNQMIDSWNAESLMIYTLSRQVFTLVAGQQAYKMGVGGDFNVPRPANIDYAGIISLNNAAQPLELPIDMLTDAQWAAIPVKNIQSSLPLQVYDDGGFPFRTLSYWCVPSVTVQTALYTWNSLTQFPDLTTQLTFPPAYLKAIRYCLAADLAPEFGVPLAPEVAQQALMTLAKIKSKNTPIIDLTCDPALNARGGTYDWRSDTYVSK